MEQYRNCNRNGVRYPAQPNLMMQYANNRNASSCNGNRQGTGGCPSRQDHCETTRKDVETCGRFSPHPIGMAYVPYQQWDTTFSAEEVRNLGNSMMRKRVCAKEPCSQI